MLKFGKGVVKYRIPILILCIAMLIPSVFGIMKTRINYDVLTYLPEETETVVGQNIMTDEFGLGAFSEVIVEGMEPKDVSKLKGEIEKIDHVASVVWYDDLLDTSVPMEILPKKYYDVFNSGDATMMAVFFDTATSADETIEAVGQIRKTVGENCFVTGMSAMVTDLRDLCEKEEPVYVAIAVICATVIMMLFMDSFLVPFIFLASIGIAIVWNLGSNVFMGEISYITKALSAVLQLAVTMDYSIFLYSSYTEQKARFNGDKERAMAHAISATITSVTGSSITTIAGFIALCFMSFTLGKDLGIVMAKGVAFGVIGCVTTLPAMLLIFDKAIEKTRHKVLLPKMEKLAHWITSHAWVSLVAFLILLVPAFIGYRNTDVYYDLGSTLPETMDYVVANNKLEQDFDLGSTHMILADSSVSQKDMEAMLNEMEDVDGVKDALGLSSVVGSSVPQEIIPKDVRDILQSENYQLILINSEYKTATDEVNEQITRLNEILKKYDEGGMLIGEAPCTKDLITITDHDFKVVDAISIAAIFLIIAIVFKSISLPVILVAAIELAIFINLGIPFYTGTQLPFIAPICISTIQLGATVDYAILMTTRYRKERTVYGRGKKESVTTALTVSIPSIVTSALGFFAATFGVALYSDVDIIGSLCNLMARGAIISMFVVIFILPSMLLLLDKLICNTTIGMKKSVKEAAKKAVV
ncbi:MAG: MMPL family transporter [Candidatus Faecivivens sp.]|nr:MMPL family transporter [Candidatus Faecivivens sp.]